MSGIALCNDCVFVIRTLYEKYNDQNLEIWTFGSFKLAYHYERKPKLPPPLNVIWLAGRLVVYLYTKHKTSRQVKDLQKGMHYKLKHRKTFKQIERKGYNINYDKIVV